jgi:CRP-like cAMP-binding protein
VHEKVEPIGAKASCLYVILQGAARLYMPIEDEDEEALPSQDEGVSANLVHTHVLEDGDSFGEQGLRTASDGSDRTRKFEVVAAIPSLLLVLERSKYQEAMTRLREDMLRGRANILRRVFAFSDWQEQDLRRLADLVTERHFNREVVIVQQGKRALDYMFFLVRGECRVLRQVDVSAVQREMLAVTSDLFSGKAETGQLTPRGAAAKQMSPVLLEVQRLPP